MYTPAYGKGEPGQDKWRWCHKCQGMWWGGSDSRGKCPSGGGHSRKGSGDYRIRYGNKPSGKYQGEWRWCRDCYGMCYSGNGNGRCPDGGGHDFRGSGAYYMPYE